MTPTSDEIRQSWGDYEPFRTEPFRNPDLVDLLYAQTPGHVPIDILRRFDPAVSTEDPTQLAIWPNSKARSQCESRRMRGRPGRMLRRFMPNLTDPDLEALTTALANKYFVDSNLEYHTQTSDIHEVYMLPPGPSAYLDTTKDQKSLFDSCMRYNEEYFDLDDHPTEVYNSGDFKIHYLVDKNGDLHARTLASNINNTRGPIYGVSQVAIDKLLEHVRDLPIAGEGSWGGHRLIFIRQNSEYAVGPYLDLYPNYGCFDPRKDQYIILGGQAPNIAFGQYMGQQAYSARHHDPCHNCRDTTRHDSNDDLVSPVDDPQHKYCRSCAQKSDLSGRFFTSRSMTQVFDAESKMIQSWSRGEAQEMTSVGHVFSGYVEYVYLPPTEETETQPQPQGEVA